MRTRGTPALAPAQEGICPLSISLYFLFLKNKDVAQKQVFY